MVLGAPRSPPWVTVQPRPGHAYLAAGQPQTHPGIVQHTAPHVNTH
jgi:hypothetical protein